MIFLKKILLVDYPPRIAEIVQRALEETGRYLVRGEPDCRQAFNAAKWFQPHLILFDINITTRDGESTAQQLQADPAFRETPIVFMSVNQALDGCIASGGILNGYSFMANPIRLEECIRYIGELLVPPTERGLKFLPETN